MQDLISCGIRYTIRFVREDLQMSFASMGENLPRWKENLLLLREVPRVYYQQLMCRWFGHKGKAHGDAENGTEFFSCDRCGYSHTARF